MWFHDKKSPQKVGFEKILARVFFLQYLRVRAVYKLYKLPEIIFFDESRLPYIVNFTDYHQVEPSFYERIRPDLVKL